MKEIKPLVAITILCVSSMMTSLTVIGPIVRKLGLQEWYAGVMVALAGIIWIFLLRFQGKKSDIYGRKNILLLATFEFFISYLLLATFVNYTVITPPLVIISLLVLVTTRLLIGVFYSAVPPISNVLIADKVEAQKRTSYMASLGASNGLSMILGPVLGGALASFGLAIPFYVAAISPLVAVFMVFFFLEKDKKTQKIEDTPLHFFDRGSRLPMIASFVTMFNIVTSQVCLGFFILGKSQMNKVDTAKTTGYILAVIGVVPIAAQIIVPKLKNVKSISWLILSSVFVTIGYSLISLISFKIELTLAFCIGTIELGMIMFAFMAVTSNGVNANGQGAAAGTVSSAQGFGIIVSPLLSTVSYKIFPEFPFLFTSLIFAILVIISLLYKKRGILY